MKGFIGEYECKLDAKGRFKIPANLLRQIPEEANNTFVINRGFEKHLALYPANEWEIITEEINKLNNYDKKVRDFRRFFYRGASEISLDSSSRLLLPKTLLDWPKIDKEIVLFCHSFIIEIWSKSSYDGLLSNEPEDFSPIAQSVMGNKKEHDGD
ncbi:MAG: division/cell wall cluster transcriptional repressor MraZ [Bacteroidetes bacterium]|jgi:MraZ protein|nr:division/cell wall cluster transcriptional repressor MraZ [Bacteroidota bacterium]MBT5529153.1 division/cell wall cluster transcriptional repressor MraZ [Cytophagia bacterium]MBT3421173.1 division/cell wall cluster transcriptional repressor MraZ [Bacteroidota bacterium]MBT3802284.1 division/cell wall cluster transcriptional repressor MraZ [Bacteroidota bacterium]MBT3933390.1 division/cell wall cluster transcriptional repressor MraZ [Bacteroidota bacterium]